MTNDERTAQDVRDRLLGHSYLDRSRIEVHVDRQHVTLRGTVTDDRALRLAGAAAAGVAGVRDVTNELRVGLPERRRNMTTG